MIGARVYHQGLGEGRVVDTRWRGMHLLVEFANGLSLWMNRETLKLLAPIEKKPHPQPPPQPRHIPTKGGNFQSRRMIEAFKLGVVPSFAISDFTFGRKNELEEVERAFESSSRKGGEVLAIEGEYGSGKTHLLDYVLTWALKEGYAVGRAELDRFDVTPYRPKHIYRELIRTLRFIRGNKEIGFREILREAKGIDLPSPHFYFSKALWLLSQDEDHPALWDWIEGEQVGRDYLNYLKCWKLPVLLDHTPAVDIYCYLLSGLGYLIKRLGGKGLVLIIDEAETLFHLWWTPYQRIGLYLFKGLVGTALNLPQLTEMEGKNRERDPGLNVGWVDGEGYIHSGIRPLPYLYQSPSHILLVLAYTPSSSPYYEGIEELVHQGRIISLSPLSGSDYSLMLERLIELYSQAFPSFQAEGGVRSLLTRNLKEKRVRMFLREAVELMDHYRHYRYGPQEV